MSDETALVKPSGNGDPVKGLSSYLNARQKNLAMFAASRVKPETLIRLALYEFAHNEWLRRCTPESIYGSLILAAQIGLEPSGIRGEASLVPFKGRCQLIPGWRGLVKLALRSKAVRSLYSHLVYDRDECRIWLGSEPRVEHSPYLDGDRGVVRAAYAVAHMDNGMIDIEPMTIDELQKIKEHALKQRGGKEGAYAEWEDQMLRKAPIRRLAKRLPLGEDFYAAVRADDLAATGEQQQMIIDIDPSAATEQREANDSINDRLADRAAAVRNGGAS